MRLTVCVRIQELANIPVELAVEVTHHRLSQDTNLAARTGIPTPALTNLLKFSHFSTYFQYDETHYQQYFGPAMRSPGSAIVTNMVMEHLEQQALATTTISPRFWKRYVDDVCAAIKSSQIGSLQSHLNSRQPSIQFTTETETNASIAFLVAQVTQGPHGQLSTTA